MNTLKGWITTTCLASMLMLSTVSANAGVIIGGFNEPTTTPCTDTTIKTQADLGGIIIGGLTGIIIGGFTGIIIGGVRTEPVENCGIIIGG